MELKTSSTGGHVAVFTYPFTSHPLVMLNMTHNLATSAPNIQFSFFNTPKSNSNLFSWKNSEPLPFNIQFHHLNDDGFVPEGSDSLQETNCFLRTLPGNLKSGVESAETKTGQKVTCFLTDAFFASAVSEMADKRNARWIGLWVPAPYALPTFLHMSYIQRVFTDADKPEDLILDIVPGFSPICYSDLPCRGVIEPELSDSMKPLRQLFQSMVQNLHRASVVISNSFQELNPEALADHLKSKFLNFLFLGTLTLSESLLSPVQDMTGCLPWLDRQKPESVAYISFGTGIGCPPEEYSALAESLDAYRIPFLWVMSDESKGHLPSGFLDRMKEKGKFVSWAPQSQILKHFSIGVYLTHCGYNSALESIIGGVPMICRPVWTDNHMTAKMIEEVWDIGVRIEGGKITKRAVIKNFDMIFRDEKGKKLKENVNILKHVLLKAAGPDGVARRDFKSLLEFISSD